MGSVVGNYMALSVSVSLLLWSVLYYQSNKSIIWCMPYDVMLTITVMSYWARWRDKSPAYRLFAQSFVQRQMKENIEAPCSCMIYQHTRFIFATADMVLRIVWWRGIRLTNKSDSTESLSLLFLSTFLSKCVRSVSIYHTIYIYHCFPILQFYTKPLINIYVYIYIYNVHIYATLWP